MVENVRVRHGGFAYRHPYDRFLHRFVKFIFVYYPFRYKMLTKVTWPQYNGSLQAGTVAIIEHMKISSEGYRTGKTKIFIKDPRSV